MDASLENQVPVSAIERVAVFIASALPPRVFFNLVRSSPTTMPRLSTSVVLLAGSLAALALAFQSPLQGALAVSLESDASFPNGRPFCENTFEDFNDASVLSKTPYGVNPSVHKVVSEEMNGYDNVNVQDGHLNIKIVKGLVPLVVEDGEKTTRARKKRPRISLDRPF